MDKNKLKMDLTIPEEVDPNKKETDSPEISDTLLETINAQNMGEGTFLFNEEEGEELPEPDVDYKSGKELELLGEYSDEMINDILKNPSKYKFTSKKHGEMNLKEAMDKGYNPETDEFDGEKMKSKEEMMEGLSESDKEAINKITDPANAKIPPKDAEQFGITDENMIDKGSEELFLGGEEELDENAIAIPEGEGEAEEGMESDAALMAMLGGME